jgi:16S rRNA (adenine1518-N6/adenine1519-N6)-dimethyltransferase
MFAKKSLGQNFLKSESALNEIISAGKVSESDFVLEIGPGRGALTEKILATGAKVFAIEKDNELIGFLNKKFEAEISSGQLVIKEGDVLDFNENIEVSEVFGDSPYKLIANIPYYITGAIIRKFLSSEKQPKLAVLLVQKEVAERIISKPEKNGTDKHPKTKESLLSMSVKAYSEPKYIKTVPAGSFAPAPSVDSAIILLENINKDKFVEASAEFSDISTKSSNVSPNLSEEKFFELLRAGFSHKRKVLRKNLESFTKKYSVDKSKITTGLEEINKPETVRAEELQITDWLCLLKKISE